jgi:PAS domain S-box-containing protein
MAHAGMEEGYLSEVNVTWNENEPLGRGPVGQAIRSSHATVRDDVVGDSEFAPWLPFAQTRGYRGNICLPLRDATHTFGVLGLYSAGVNQTSTEELRLLQQMADDLAFGIGSVRADAERDRLDSQSREQAALLDIANEAIMVKDLEGRIVYWNKGAERTYGWSAAEALGRKAVALLHNDAAQYLEAEMTLLAHGQWTGEMVKQTKDGRAITVEVRWTLVRNEEGRPKSTLIINTDITERKQAAATLRAAEERIRFALQNANVGIWDLDYATGECRWSEILESQCGLRPGTFGGTFEAFVQLVHPDDREAVREAVGNAMKSGADFSYVHRVIWPDGTKRWLTGAGRILLGERGEPVRGVGTYQDVTERHALEAQLAQSQKMEAIGQLAGGIAHDFNNLLTVIGGRSSLLLMKMRSDDPARKEIDLIQSTAQRAAGLTRQLLAFSRKQVLEPKPVNLQTLVDGVTPMLRRLIGEHIEVVIVSGHDLGQVMADPGQVEQVVVNLVVNARDAMPDGGTLTIETSNRTVKEAGLRAPDRPVPSGQYVTLSVVDTGYGMDPATVTRIFEPFFTTKEPGKGTGLGLSTVHGIVHQSGGYLVVESAVGRGTTFTISLPRILDPVSVARVAQEPRLGLLAGSGTVLLVEDDEELRRLASEILRTSGYTVLETGDPHEALTIGDSQEGVIDLLLTDMVMPAMRGTELAARLRESHPGLKILFMSGYVDETGASMRAGGPARPFLQKPFTPHDLTRTVREILAEERAEALP